MIAEGKAKRRILFSAWFLSSERLWIGEYLDPERYVCEYVGLAEPMLIDSERTRPKKWYKFFVLAVKTRWHLMFNRYDLIVSAFPAGGFMLALLNRLTFERTPHVVWYFNCGHIYQGLRRRVSRFAFRHVNRFIVYTRQERTAYAKVFAQPLERFRFTYLTGTPLDRRDFRDGQGRWDLADRYIAALGSSGRDFKTLFEAVKNLDIQTVVVTHRHAVKGLPIPRQVKIIESIRQDDYLRILAGAEICVISVDNPATASGQMTLIQAMSLRVPVVATRCIGTEDYLVDGETGRFVQIGDPSDLRAVLMEHLSDSSDLKRLARNALEFARKHFVDDAGARELDDLYTELAKAGELTNGDLDADSR